MKNNPLNMPFLNLSFLKDDNVLQFLMLIDKLFHIVVPDTVKERLQ